MGRPRLGLLSCLSSGVLETAEYRFRVIGFRAWGSLCQLRVGNKEL